VKHRIDRIEQRLRGLPAPGARAAVPARFGRWLEQAWPQDRWDWPHFLHLQERLDALTRAERDRLMLFMPPRHGKSQLVTIRYVAWRLLRQPELRVILCAYNQDLADQFSRRIRAIVRQHFGLSAECAAVDEWETPAGGGLRAAGVGSGITGMGADLIVIDDPVKSREEAESRAFRQRAWEWYTDDLSTRQEPGCAVALIMTRWHDDDLAGRLLRSEEGPDWEVARLPALAETPEERDAWAARHGRPLGAPDPLAREPGRALWPERYPEEALHRQRRLMGATFQPLYQQSPRPAEGGLFRRDWFPVVERAPDNLPWVRFWDCAAAVSRRSDYTAGALVGRSPAGVWYIRDIVRGRWEYPEMKRVILQTAALDGRDVRIGIEDSANGTATLQDLRREPGAGHLAIVPLRAAADKAVRAGAWASRAEGGLVALVRGPWVAAFLDELDLFPAGAYDDQVDAVSGASELLLGLGGGGGCILAGSGVASRWSEAESVSRRSRDGRSRLIAPRFW
jgi:predicted phage terminase large subunit-like protein